MPEVAEIRWRGFMVGIDLGAHDPALRMGHRVTLEARHRGALVRPLGDTIVLVPPLSISTEDLDRLLTITADSIAAACGVAPGAATPLGDGARVPYAA
jgi:adenosylmethionine-8-amino-7-oxononanoate aminotransferase